MTKKNIEIVPRCIKVSLSIEKKEDYENLIYDFYKTQNCTLEDIKAAIDEEDDEKLRNLQLTEERLNSGKTLTCEYLASKYNVKLLCEKCKYLRTTPDIKPQRIRESLILNLAQQEKRILEVINPVKFTSIMDDTENVLLYKEFYNYLKDKKSIKDKKLLKALELTYQNNITAPAKMKELNSLLDFLIPEGINSISDLIETNETEEISNINAARNNRMNKSQGNTLITKTVTTKNENYENNNKEVNNEKSPGSNISGEKTKEETIEISSTNNEFSNILLSYPNVAIEFKDNTLFLYGEEKKKFIIPYNENTSKLIKKILESNKNSVITSSITIFNDFIKKGIRIRKIIPLDIIFKSFGVNKKIIYEELLKTFLEKEKSIDKNLLCFIKLSTNTDGPIEIEDAGVGFYKVKSAENDKVYDYYMEINVESIIKNIYNMMVTYKSLYFNVAKIMNDYNERKIKYNVIEISEKFCVSCPIAMKKDIMELIRLTFRDAVQALSPTDVSIINIIEYKREH